MAENKKKIVLVEDDPAIMDIYQTILQKAGFLVQVLSLGADVMNMIKEIQAKETEKPDILLLDLILPDMNGLEILKEMKKHQETKNITIFILSNQQEQDALKDSKAKPDKFIVKANITPTQLADLIKEKLK